MYVTYGTTILSAGVALVTNAYLRRLGLPGGPAACKRVLMTFYPALIWIS